VERKERKRINQVKFSNGQHRVVEFQESVPPNDTLLRANQNGRSKKNKQKTKLRLTRRFPFMKSVENVNNIQNNTNYGEKVWTNLIFSRMHVFAYTFFQNFRSFYFPIFF
jgi:hypothetical protein